MFSSFLSTIKHVLGVSMQQQAGQHNLDTLRCYEYHPSLNRLWVKKRHFCIWNNPSCQTCSRHAVGCARTFPTLSMPGFAERRVACRCRSLILFAAVDPAGRARCHARSSVRITTYQHVDQHSSAYRSSLNSRPDDRSRRSECWVVLACVQAVFSARSRPR